MKYKFESKDENDDTYLEIGAVDNSLQIDFGCFSDEQYGGFMNISSDEIDNMIKALMAIKEEISGEKSDSFKIITKN